MRCALCTFCAVVFACLFTRLPALLQVRRPQTGGTLTGSIQPTPFGPLHPADCNFLRRPRISNPALQVPDGISQKSSASAHVLGTPRPVDAAPDLVRIGILQNGRQPLRTNIVIAVQHAKSRCRGWHAHGRKSRMAGGGKRTPVIHRRAHGHSRRHLVVQQPPDFGPQCRFDHRIVGIIRPLPCPNTDNRSDCLPVIPQWRPSARHPRPPQTMSRCQRPRSERPRDPPESDFH